MRSVLVSVGWALAAWVLRYCVVASDTPGLSLSLRESTHILATLSLVFSLSLFFLSLMLRLSSRDWLAICVFVCVFVCVCVCGVWCVCVCVCVCVWLESNKFNA